jgi:hypothetical protein
VKFRCWATDTKTRKLPSGSLRSGLILLAISLSPRPWRRSGYTFDDPLSEGAGHLRLTADALRRMSDAPVQDCSVRRSFQIQIAEVHGGLLHVTRGRRAGRRRERVALPCRGQ